MKFHSETIEFPTNGFPEVVDLTDHVQSVLLNADVSNGLLTVFVPGSTAGVTTVEFEPGLLLDFRALCERLAPLDAKYQHDQAWHDGNGYAHVLAALLKPSLSIPVGKGAPSLGNWQQVVLAEFDNRPRRREVIIQVIGE